MLCHYSSSSGSISNSIHCVSEKYIVTTFYAITQLGYIEDHLFLVIFFVLSIRSVNIPNLFHFLVPCTCFSVCYTVFVFLSIHLQFHDFIFCGIT